MRLSQLLGVTVGDIAESFYIHACMLSRWRRPPREGPIVTQGADVDPAVTAELKALRQVRRQYERLKLEHDLLKKCIAFTSARKATFLPSSSIIKKRIP